MERGEATYVARLKVFKNVSKIIIPFENTLEIFNYTNLTTELRKTIKHTVDFITQSIGKNPQKVQITSHGETISELLLS